MGPSSTLRRAALAAFVVVLLAVPLGCDAASALKVAENKLREQGLLHDTESSFGARHVEDGRVDFGTSTEHPSPTSGELKFRASREILEGLDVRSRRKTYAVRTLREVLKLEPDHRQAMTLLGRAFQSGEGVAQDDAAALTLFKRAAELGDPGAHQELGFAYSVGWAGVPRSTPHSVLHQYFASMGGDQLAQMAMGHRHLFGNGVPKSCQSAVLFYDPPAALFSDASFAQTSRFGSGPVTEKIRLSSEHTRSGSSHTRERDVAQYYQYSADMGNADAASAVGRLLTNGARGVPVDRLAAYKYFTQAAAAGDADAMSHLGHMWANGIGVGSPNNETALALFHAAAEKGNARGVYGLGYMTLSGFGVARDTQAAVKFFTTAAEQGLAEAQFMLGALYSRGVVGAPGDVGDGKEKESANGQGASKTTPPPKRDHAKAFYNFNLAASQGHAVATYNLAMMQLSGSLGLPTTCKSACLLLKGLAERGHWVSSMDAARELVKTPSTKKAGLVKYMKLAEAGLEVAQANAAFVLDGSGQGWWDEEVGDTGDGRDDMDAVADSSTPKTVDRDSAGDGTRGGPVRGITSQPPVGTAATRRKKQPNPPLSRQQRALHYHRLAADQGNVFSLLKIGDAYWYGRGVNSDSLSKQSREGASSGDGSSSGSARHETAAVGNRNASAAVYLRASQLRSAQAMFNLGDMHERGVGLPKDLHLAKRYYDMALSTDPKAFVPVRLALLKLCLHTWVLEKGKESVFVETVVDATRRAVSFLVELFGSGRDGDAWSTRPSLTLPKNIKRPKKKTKSKSGIVDFDTAALAVLAVLLGAVVLVRFWVGTGLVTETPTEPTTSNDASSPETSAGDENADVRET